MTMFKVNPGKYRNIVMFQKQEEVQNPYGENTEVWVDVLKARVGIFPISGKELIEALSLQGEITHKILMRYHPTIKVDSHMRIKFGDRIFNIISPPINFQEANVEVQLLCKEVV